VAPAVDRPLAPELLVHPNRAVEGDPGHDLGVREVPQRPAHLPDAGVWFVPVAGHEVGKSADRPPGFGVELMAFVRQQPGCINHPPVDVELVLVACFVADPDREASPVAGQTIYLAFLGRRLAVERVEDLQLRPRQTTGVEQPMHE
jgi:hypothetical protein